MSSFLLLQIKSPTRHYGRLEPKAASGGWGKSRLFCKKFSNKNAKEILGVIFFDRLRV
jgi:hypothetical protein